MRASRAAVSSTGESLRARMKPRGLGHGHESEVGHSGTVKAAGSKAAGSKVTAGSASAENAGGSVPMAWLGRGDRVGKQRMGAPEAARGGEAPQPFGVRTFGVRGVDHRVLSFLDPFMASRRRRRHHCGEQPDEQGPLEM
jgi:hypothetical protein